MILLRSLGHIPFHPFVRIYFYHSKKWQIYAEIQFVNFIIANLIIQSIIDEKFFPFPFSHLLPIHSMGKEDFFRFKNSFLIFNFLMKL